MSDPRKDPLTLREALIAQALTDLDGLVARIEALPEQIAVHEAKALAVADALKEASEKYEEAARGFTKDMMASLLKNVHAEAQKAVDAVDAQAKVLMLKSAQEAFGKSAQEAHRSLQAAIGTMIDGKLARLHKRWLFGMLTAVSASGCVTAGVVLFLR